MHIWKFLENIWNAPKWHWMFSLIFGVRIYHLVVIDPFFQVVTSTCIIIRCFETIEEHWVGWSLIQNNNIVYNSRLCNGNCRQKWRNQMWKVKVNHFKVQTSVGWVSQIPLSITPLSFRHLSLIPLGYYPKWYPHWKLNYRTWTWTTHVSFLYMVVAIRNPS
jgi:hypothetical protein